MLPASPRPLLSIPHLLSGEASAYYHGYILAEMAVYQTRDYFRTKYGFLTDNPAIGPELRETYWTPGNSRTFLEPFGPRATVELVDRSEHDVVDEVDRMIAKLEEVPGYNGPIDLDATIAIVHGDEVITTTADGLGFAEMAEQFRAWVVEMER